MNGDSLATSDKHHQSINPTASGTSSVESSAGRSTSAISMTGVGLDSLVSRLRRHEPKPSRPSRRPRRPPRALLYGR